MKLAWALTLASVALAQAPPAFEAASIRPSAEPPSQSGVTTDTGRIRMENVTLRRAIRTAYRIPEAQIIGGPDWVTSERWHINAKSEGPATMDEMRPMMRSLLAERFQLTVHRESRMLSGYALVVGKGLLAKRSAADDSNANTNTRTSNAKASIEAQGSTMEGLAQILAEILTVPVVAETGAEGRFDFRLEWTPDDLLARPNSDAPAGPSVFTAVQEQLGLKLESRKVPVEVIVIDSVQRPSEN